MRFILWTRSQQSRVLQKAKHTSIVRECQHLNNLTRYFSIVVSSAKLSYLIKIPSGVTALRKTELAITHYEKVLFENTTPKLYNR